jgi:hypothetical protein
MRQIRKTKYLLNVLFTLIFISSPLPAADSLQSYQKLLAQLERENNPAEKGRTMLKLADWQLNQAILESGKEEWEKTDKLLVQYTDWIKDAQSRFHQEYLKAPKKNQNTFRQAEILLNKQLRRLENLKTNYSFDQQDRIRQAIAIADKTREDLLSYLFGEENVRGESTSQKDQN